MGQAYKADFEVDNGVDYDKYNFSTTADQVSYTKNGKETNVQAGLDALNTSFEKLGSIKPTASGTVTVPSSSINKPTNICSIWLAPGIYLIEGTAKFNMTDQTFIEIHIESADGKHKIGNTALTLPAGIQWVKNTGIIKVEETSKQIVLSVRQTSESGNAISCTSYMAVTQVR